MAGDAPRARLRAVEPDPEGVEAARVRAAYIALAQAIRPEHRVKPEVRLNA
jgi:hypothetical protein